MNVEIGAEAALFPEKEYISGIFVAGQARNWTGQGRLGDATKRSNLSKDRGLGVTREEVTRQWGR